MKITKNMIRIIGLFLSMQVWAYTPLSSSKVEVARVSKTYFSEGNTLDLEKIKVYREKIKTKRTEIYEISYNERVKRVGQSKKKARKKALEDVADYDLLLKMIDNTKSLKDYPAKIEHIQSIEAFSYALLKEGNPLFYVDLLEGVRGYFKKYAVQKKNLPLGEAKNLVAPTENKSFFEQNELEELKEAKKDISLFEPPKNSPFVFQRDDISKVDVKDSYLNGKNRLYEGLDVWWPETNVFKLKKIKKTQSKPKLDVLYINPKTGKEEVFKIKLAEEIHSEGTVAALANTIGIYTDLSKNLRDIKVHLGKTSYNEFRTDWYSYFDGFDLDRLVKEQGSDENGDYLVFYDGLIEQKLKEEESYKRIGPWAWGGNDHKHQRETRGLFLFSVWIGNTDLKEAENNKLVIRTKESGIESFKVMHDIGFSLGNLLSEKPLNFKWNPIKKVKDDEIVFDFFNIQDNSGYAHVTYADARWMIRKIAQLTRKQIEDSVEIGGWPKEEPYNIHRLLIEKLISRRNHFVKTFGLLGETLPNGSKIEWIEFTKKDIEQVPEYIGEYTVDFSKEASDLTRDPLRQIPHLILNLMKVGVSTIQKIEIDPIELGIDAGFISQIIVSVERELVRNPNPKDESETFLVKDKFLIGTRIGAGYIISGDVAKYREYTLIRTARTEHEAKYKDNFFLNLRLPFQVMLKNLPKSHILSIADYFETRGRIKIQTPGAALIGLGTEGTISKLSLGRTIISKNKSKDIIFYEDKSNFNQLAFRAFVTAGLLKIPFATINAKKGKINRDVYTISTDKLIEPAAIEAVTAIIDSQDHSKIKIIAKPTKLSSDFLEKNFKVNVLGFMGKTSYQRRDYVTNYGTSDSSEDDTTVFQMERVKGSFWYSILGSRVFEEFSQIVTEKNRNGEVTDSILKLHYLHDDNRVTSKELKKVYLNFLNAVGKNGNMINFSPEMHTSNGEWGHLNVRLSLDIYKTGLEKVSKMKLSSLLRAATKITGDSYPKLGRLYKSLMRATHSRSNTVVKNPRFTYRGKKYYYKSLFRDLKKFALRIKDINKNAKKDEEVSAGLLNAFYKGVKKKEGSFSPLILRSVIEEFEKEDYFLEVTFLPQAGSENKLPERVIPYNNEGIKQEVQSHDFLTSLDDTLNVFEHFSKLR
jgi:hypothetical protein